MDTVLPIVRHGGQLLAGYLIGKGYIDESMTETLIGAMVSIVTLAWYLIQKKKKA